MSTREREALRALGAVFAGIVRLPLWDLRFAWHGWRARQTGAAAKRHARRVIELSAAAAAEADNMESLATTLRGRQT
jgi:hypothetical protein